MFFLMASLIASLMAGCEEPGPERAIIWSGDGRSVGFQHGPEGIFLAAADGSSLRKVFQPGPDATATSPPLSSPTDSRLIFTTARWDPRRGFPEGAGDAIYTCWLDAAAAGGAQAVPTALFQEPCHVDYVEMNAAVRWHPSGRSILFIRRLDGDRHGLFEYDLGSKQSHRVFPHTAKALSFEWAPGGTQLVCVLGGKDVDPDIAGLWVGDPTKGDWWHVPTNEDVSSLRDSRLDTICGRQPIWTRDAARFATQVEQDASSPQGHPHYQLLLGAPLNRGLTVRLDEPMPLLELHWSPDGKKLGFLRGSDELCLLAMGDKSSPAPRRKGVRRFLGWDASGQYLAFVIPQRVRAIAGHWASLFAVDFPPRDCLYVANGTDASNEQPVLSGMRVAFPQWSPRDAKLSLWIAFQPPYRSWIGILLFQGGQQSHGSAAVLDANTRQLRWLPVNSDDRVQMGHCAVVKGKYGEALGWYERAEREFAADRESRSAETCPPRRLADRMGLPLFEYFCLSKLGRQEEARRALRRFDETFISPEMARSAVAQMMSPGTVAFVSTDREERAISKAELDSYAEELLDAGGYWPPAAKDLYLAEYFLALDAGDQAATLLRRWLSRTKADGARLAHAMVLGQVLLLQERYKEYAKLATEEMIPLLQRLPPSKPPRSESERRSPSQWRELMTCAAVEPLFVPEFLDKFSSAEVNALVDRWQPSASSDPQQTRWFMSQLGLYAAYARLGKLEDARRAEGRFNKAAASPANPFHKPTAKEAIEEIRREAARR